MYTEHFYQNLKFFLPQDVFKTRFLSQNANKFSKTKNIFQFSDFHKQKTNLLLLEILTKMEKRIFQPALLYHDINEDIY